MFEASKKFFWKLIEPIFPTIRDIWVGLGFMEHNIRQPYLLGRLKNGLNELDFRQLLKTAGFDNDYIGWIDPDEVVNMRKIVDTIYQYHVRLFSDGAIHGHHEYTPESHPFRHLFDIGMSEAKSFLTPLLEEIMIPEAEAAKSSSILPPLHSAARHTKDNDADQ